MTTKIKAPSISVPYSKFVRLGRYFARTLTGLALAVKISSAKERLQPRIILYPYHR